MRAIADDVRYEGLDAKVGATHVSADLEGFRTLDEARDHVRGLTAELAPSR